MSVNAESCSLETEQFWDGSSVFISRECYAEMLCLQMWVYCKLDGAPSHKLCTNQQWKVKKEFWEKISKVKPFGHFSAPCLNFQCKKNVQLVAVIICSSAALRDAWWSAGKLRSRRGNKQFIVSPNCTFPTMHPFITEVIIKQKFCLIDKEFLEFILRQSLLTIYRFPWLHFSYSATIHQEMIIKEKFAKKKKKLQ